jgi:hypothetical protein
VVKLAGIGMLNVIPGSRNCKLFSFIFPEGQIVTEVVPSILKFSARADK